MQNIIFEVDKQSPTPTHDKCFFLKIHENWIFIENYSIVKIPVEMWMHTSDVMPSRRCLEKMKKILFKIVWQIVGKGRKVIKQMKMLSKLEFSAKCSYHKDLGMESIWNSFEIWSILFENLRFFDSKESKIFKKFNEN